MSFSLLLFFCVIAKSALASNCTQNTIQVLASGGFTQLLRPDEGDYLLCLKYKDALFVNMSTPENRYCLFESWFKLGKLLGQNGTNATKLKIVHGMCLPKVCNARTYVDSGIPLIEKVKNLVAAFAPKYINESIVISAIVEDLLSTANITCSDDTETVGEVLSAGTNPGATLFVIVFFTFCACVVLCSLLHIILSMLEQPLATQEGPGYDGSKMPIAKPYYELNDHVNDGPSSFQQQTETGYIEYTTDSAHKKPSSRSAGEREAVTPLQWLIKTFSIQHNIERLLDTSKNEFPALNGIRVISMFWVILGHSLLLTIHPVLHTSFQIADIVTQFSFTLVQGAFFAVDTFFFLSGFFGAYKCIPMWKDKSFSLFTCLKIYFLRYMRLTPVYSIILLFFVSVFPYMGNGPYWRGFQLLSTNSSSICSKYWWTNLLYINNIYPMNASTLNSCMGWTWYLANDTQFFILLPIICYFFAKRPNVGYIIVGILVTMQISVTAMDVAQFDLLGAKSGSVGGDKDTYIYVKPWCRVTPFVLGIAFQHLYSESKRLKRKMSFTLFMILFSIAGILMASTIFGYYNEIVCPEDHPYCGYGLIAPGNWGLPGQSWQGYMYFSLTYLAWGLGIGILVMCFSHGWGGFVKHFLSNPVWVPLARLTYTAYLTHLILMTYSDYTTLNVTPISVDRMAQQTVAYVVLAYSCGLFCYLFFEKPIMNIMSSMLRR